MRILYFSRGYTTHDRRFLAAFAAAGHETWFLTGEPSAPAQESRALPHGVRTVPPASAARNLHAVIDEIRPHVVHAGPIPNCGILAARSGFHPLALMSWGSDLLVEADSDTRTLAEVREALECADLFVCDCEEVADKAREIAPARTGKSVGFPWGIELERFPKRDCRNREKQDEIRVISTRSWRPGYGVETALEAFRLAHNEDDRLRLTLVGGGPLDDEIREWVRCHDLGHAIKMPGRVPETELPGFLGEAEIYLSCAPSDGSSISLLEAMASYLPAIVTDRRSNREWVTPGLNGAVAPAGDAGAFADRLLAMAHMSPLERWRRGLSNRATAETRADWSRNFPRLLAAYKEIGASDDKN